MARPTTEEIASRLRMIIEGQIARSGTGRAVAALVDDADVMARFVTNIVGNLTMAVDGWIDDGICESCLKPLTATESGPCDDAADDLETCADCEASTAEGTPDPHVCGEVKQ